MPCGSPIPGLPTEGVCCGQGATWPRPSCRPWASSGYTHGATVAFQLDDTALRAGTLSLGQSPTHASVPKAQAGDEILWALPAAHPHADMHFALGQNVGKAIHLFFVLLCVCGKIHLTKVIIFLASNLVAFSTFTMLCQHHLCAPRAVLSPLQEAPAP